MTGREVPGTAALDAYISTLLRRAADTYASRTDLLARLEALIQEAGNSTAEDNDGGAARG